MASSIRPVLVTLTAPSAAGKSYLFNYIRDVAKLPCLISTTTRAPRAGEKEGIDYFFITEEQSKQLEEANMFAELAIYNGARYGVTKQEFFGKLGEGVAFLIVEPSGIDHYVQPALDIGAIHLKYFIYVDPEVRLERFTARVQADIKKAYSLNFSNTLQNNVREREDIQKIVSTSLKRLTAMLTEEKRWGTVTNWTRTLFGTDAPEKNLEIISADCAKAIAHAFEVDEFNQQKRLEEIIALDQRKNQLLASLKQS
jgi:guanylate kinase